MVIGKIYGGPTVRRFIQTSFGFFILIFTHCKREGAYFALSDHSLLAHSTKLHKPAILLEISHQKGDILPFNDFTITKFAALVNPFMGIQNSECGFVTTALTRN